jgi:GGDEF domain-containing protein
MGRLEHEFRRTRRYGREFSCISLRLDDLDELGVETAAVALRRVAAALAGALRTTDDAAYLFDGTFVVLAPETMANRASTLGQRLAERVQRDLDGLPGAGAAPPVGFVAFSFDGWNAAAPEEVVRRVLAG